MKKYLFLLIAIAAVLVTTLSGCGDDNAEEKTKDNVAQEQEKEEKEIPLGFENENLVNAVATALGKDVNMITEQDLTSIKYLAIGIDEDDETKYSILVGLDDYMDAYIKLMNDSSLSTDILMETVKKAPLVYNKEKDSFSDLDRFTGINVFEYYDIKIDDVSFVKAYPSLVFGYFNNNGITDVSSLEGYDTETLSELDFTANDIADWTPLYHIKEKVIVHYEVRYLEDADGNDVTMPILITLEDKIRQDEEARIQEGAKKAAEEAAKAIAEAEAKQNGTLPENEAAENEAVENETEDEAMFVDGEGNPVDFAQLFD